MPRICQKCKGSSVKTDNIVKKAPDGGAIKGFRILCKECGYAVIGWFDGSLVGSLESHSSLGVLYTKSSGSLRGNHNFIENDTQLRVMLKSLNTEKLAECTFTYFDGDCLNRVDILQEKINKDVPVLQKT